MRKMLVLVIALTLGCASLSSNPYVGPLVKPLCQTFLKDKWCETIPETMEEEETTNAQ